MVIMKENAANITRERNTIRAEVTATDIVKENTMVTVGLNSPQEALLTFWPNAAIVSSMAVMNPCSPL